MNNFWNKLNKPIFALAPMEEMTDCVLIALRRVLFYNQNNLAGIDLVGAKERRMKKRVGIWADNGLWNSAFRQALRCEEEVELLWVDESPQLEQTLAGLDILVVAILAPPVYLLEKLVSLRKREHPLPQTVVIFNWHLGNGLTEEFIKLGTVGFLYFGAAAKDFSCCMAAVCRDNLYCDHRVTDWTPAAAVESLRGLERRLRGTLTAREKEILKLLAEGNSVRQVACDLNLADKTVETHKYNLMRKLDIHKRAGLVRYAVATHLISIPHDVGMGATRVLP